MNIGTTSGRVIIDGNRVAAGCACCPGYRCKESLYFSPSRWLGSSKAPLTLNVRILRQSAMITFWSITKTSDISEVVEVQQKMAFQVGALVDVTLYLVEEDSDLFGDKVCYYAEAGNPVRGFRIYPGAKTTNGRWDAAFGRGASSFIDSRFVDFEVADIGDPVEVDDGFEGSVIPCMDRILSPQVINGIVPAGFPFGMSDLEASEVPNPALGSFRWSFYSKVSGLGLGSPVNPYITEGFFDCWTLYAQLSVSDEVVLP